MGTCTPVWYTGITQQVRREKEKERRDEMGMEKEIGWEIRRLAERKDMTLMQLSERSGVSRSALYMYMAGKRSIPMQALQQIAAVLGARVSEIVREAEERGWMR